MKSLKKVNLVVFTRDYPVGMAGTKRIQHLLDYLLSQDVTISVIAFRSYIRQPAIKGTCNSIPYSCIGPGIKMNLWHLHKIILYYIRGIIAIRNLKRKDFSNIVYNSGGINIENFLFILWAKFLGFKLVLAIEEDYSHFKDKIKLISRFKFWTIRRFDHLNSVWAEAIVVVSKYLRNKYIEIKARNVVLIPITAKLNHDKEKKYFNAPLEVCYAGTFADKDGVNDIIRGFMLFNKLFENALLILTGKSEQQKIYEEKFKDQKNIIFKGFVPDNEFYPMLRKADVLCMCRTESGFANAGFPFKLGEYLATGNPVICTRVSDVETYLTDADAFLIDPNSPEQICESLLEIVKYPEKAKLIGINGMKKGQQFFSPEVNGMLLFNLLTSQKTQ